MKIIANISSEIVLAQCTRDEICQIMGYHSTYYVPGDSNNKLPVGTVVNVNEMYQAVHEVGEIKQTVEKALETHAKLTASVQRLFLVLEPVHKAIESKQPKR